MTGWTSRVTLRYLDGFVSPAKLDELARIEAWRAGGGMASAHYWINDEGEVEDMGTKMAAPSNPYRPVDEGRTMGWASIAGDGGRMPPRYDTDRGPGLTGTDLHALAQSHHLAGYAKAEREFESKLEDMRGQLAGAFDEGYTAGRVSRAQGLARDVHMRLMQAHFALAAVEQGPKTKREERLGALRVALNEVIVFAEAIESQTDMAAAQVARDEG